MESAERVLSRAREPRRANRNGKYMYRVHGNSEHVHVHVHVLAQRFVPGVLRSDTRVAAEDLGHAGGGA